MAIYTSSYSVSASSQSQGFTIDSFDPTDAGLNSALNTSTTSINGATGLPRTPEEYASIAAFWSSNTSPDNAVASMNAYGVTIGDVTQATGISNQDVIDFLIEGLYWNITSKSSDDFNVFKDTLTPVGPLEAVVFGRYDTSSSWYFTAGESNVKVKFRESAPYTSESYTIGVRIARATGLNFVPTGVSFSITFEKFYTLAAIDPVAFINFAGYAWQSGTELNLTQEQIAYPYVTHRTTTDANGFVTGPSDGAPASSAYPFKWKLPGSSTFAFAGDTAPSITITLVPGSQNPFTYEVWTSDESTLLGTYTNYFSASNPSYTVGPGQSSQGLSIVRDATSPMAYPATTSLSFRPGYGVNGSSPYSYYVTPSLPSGISLSTSTGVISGVPYAVNSPTTYTFTVIDANNASASLTFTLSITEAGVTYSVTPSVTSVNEGGSVQFNITTTFVPNGTTLYWTILGTNVTEDDFSDPLGGLTGSVTINNSQASFSKSLRTDLEGEGNESFVLQLRTGSILGPVVASTPSISIGDVSTSPFDNVLDINGAVGILTNFQNRFGYYSNGVIYAITGTAITLS